MSPFLLKSFKLLGGSNPNNSSQSVISGVSSPSSYDKRYIANKENILLPKFDIDEEYTSHIANATSTKLNKPTVSSPLAQSESNTKSITAMSKSTTTLNTDPFSDSISAAMISPPQPQYLEDSTHRKVPILSNLPTQLKLKKSQSHTQTHAPHKNPQLQSIQESKSLNLQLSNTRTTPLTPHAQLNPVSLSSQGKVLMRDQIYVVERKYRKNLADELNLNVGEFCTVLKKHDDGWCLIELVKGHRAVGVRGMVPFVCLKKMF
ncbi:unnamed protein product [Ambrosiozyma monospora]|uniref:Unnamed protein product n=1 Tax=Ambrosiozyma monospora TaxID=43982 RepID=A0A9W6Z0E8_AMBMO|nr:unnamed protein product [Ambrosiozyma monospora]